MFKVLSRVDEIELKKYPISSQTLAIGDLLDRGVGATTWTVCTASSVFFTRKVIAYEAVTTSATEFLGYEVKGDEDVEATADSTASADDNGDRMLLTDKDSVNNSGTDSDKETACFIQDRLGKDSSHIIGRILVGNGVNPDATT